MLAKRPIYNAALNCVAYEVVSSHQDQEIDQIASPLLTMLSQTDHDLPLFLPFAMRPLVESMQDQLTNPIILKLFSDEIEHCYSMEDIASSIFSIALVIEDPQQLKWINLAEYLALTDKIIEDHNMSKVIAFSQAKRRKVIAYDIHQPQRFNYCKDLQVDYYCGDFLFMPDESNQMELAANKLNLLELVRTLQSERTDLNDVSRIIQSDPLLSYQLLKLANSAAFASYSAIDSIDQAITRLGIINLKNWAMVFTLKNISDKPSEILESGLLRAYMAAQLCQEDPLKAQRAYTAGLLSILDSLLDKPMASLVDKLALAEDVKTALISHEGPLGELLKLIIAYEEGHWQELATEDYQGHDLAEVYIECLAKVCENRQSLTAH